MRDYWLTNDHLLSKQQVELPPPPLVLSSQNLEAAVAFVDNEYKERQAQGAQGWAGLGCLLLHLLPPSQPLHPVSAEEQQSLEENGLV